MSLRPVPPAYWFGDAPPPAHMRALSRVYGGAVALRRALYRRGWLRRHRIEVPVVVVGNLIAGGSGKTPLTIAIAQRLREAGRTPGIATRGYGRDDESTACWIDAGTDPAIGGDEPVLLARRTGARVRADRDRVAAARALARAGCDVVVCDDGLQHYRLARDVEIEVIDGRRGHGNGLLLPAGPLREPLARAAECDFRVVNLAASAGTAAGTTDARAVGPAGHAPRYASSASLGDGDGDSDGPGFGQWPMRLQPGDAVPLAGGRARPLSVFAGQRVHAVAGTGDPERFFAMLRGLGIGVVPHAFPDHHAFVADDLVFGSDLPVLMTEKDAVKCTAFAGGRHYAVPVEAILPEAFWVALLDKVRSER